MKLTDNSLSTVAKHTKGKNCYKHTRKTLKPVGISVLVEPSAELAAWKAAIFCQRNQQYTCM